MTTEPVRVAVWSGPRSLSTAMMRAWENRDDCVVVDEPLYAAYLARTGIDHPGRAEVLGSQPTDLSAVVASLHGAVPDGVRVHYAKHMAHHLADDMDLAWTTTFRNVLLIRDPGEVVASYVRSREACEPADIGLLQQVRLLDTWPQVTLSLLVAASLRSGNDGERELRADARHRPGSGERHAGLRRRVAGEHADAEGDGG